MRGKHLVDFIQSNTLENAEFFGMIDPDSNIGYEFEIQENIDLIEFVVNNQVVIKLIPIPVVFE